jgi:hypothetical protein
VAFAASNARKRQDYPAIQLAGAFGPNPGRSASQQKGIGRVVVDQVDDDVPYGAHRCLMKRPDHAFRQARWN